MDSVNVRNLEQIQEEDSRRRETRWATLLFASLAGAALVFAFVTAAGGRSGAEKADPDPLAKLVAETKATGPVPEKLAGKDVSFPRMLSDGPRTTTALAAVKDERGQLVKQEPGAAASATLPPVASDRLPVVPLPVGALLGATSVVTDPKDELTVLAASAAKPNGALTLAPAGADGGYQIQIASFKDQADADKLVDELRQRGHSAFRQAAYVPNRGLWHRVRIGPFKTLFEANQYKKNFERTERVAPFVIDPDKVKQAEELRESRIQAREKKAQAQADAAKKRAASEP
jgi:cell division septation protein DedD